MKIICVNGLTIAIVGSSGALGREILNQFDEGGITFPLRSLKVLSLRRAGGQFLFRQKVHYIEAFEKQDFSKIDICFLATESDISRQLAPMITRHGCFVIDSSSYWRMDPDVPLIVPEVNPEAIAYAKKRIIANPNCTTIQLVLALAPLHKAAPISHVFAATYQSVSGAGAGAIDELIAQTKDFLIGKPKTKEPFSKPIAFNVIPSIDTPRDDGLSKEEWKMNVETKKILDQGIDVTGTCVRVPTFVGHAIAAHITLKKPLSPKDVRKLYEPLDEILVVDRYKDGGFITPSDIAGTNIVYISRIRADKTLKNGLALWIVADNLRRGGAYNAVSIANLLAQKEACFSRE